jgi:predicted ATPase/DNA-binding XRE family transcriptional regulator
MTVEQHPEAAGRAERPFWSLVVRAIREARGITQEGFAAQLGYSRRTVRRWESGEGAPDADAERLLVAYCRDQALIRRLDLGPRGSFDLTPEHLRDLLADARVGGVAAPAPASATPAPATTPAPSTGLPATLSSFIGRERELAEVSEQIGSSRLLTLTGPGGVGKTRLAVMVGTAVQERFPDGVRFVDLAPLGDTTQLLPAVAQACGVQEIAGQLPAEQLRRHLADKRVLLILDNFEHLIDAAPRLTELLAPAPDVRALVTSRAALRVGGEQEYPLLPLPAPRGDRGESAADLAEYPAVRLFMERARAVRPALPITDETVAAVAAICSRLDGLALAIELAAARTRLFPPAALLARLDRRLPLLADGPRDLPRRHQSLRDTIAWSYDLLTPEEQRLFRRLAVFVGGCTLEAAAAVCGVVTESRHAPGAALTPAGLDFDAIDRLASLVDKSLLQQVEGADGEPRVTMLETIREFAVEQLADSGEAATVAARHAQHYLKIVETAGPALLGAGRRPGQLAAEQGNIHAALRWLVTSG